jgi:hypothetical protein
MTIYKYAIRRSNRAVSINANKWSVVHLTISKFLLFKRCHRHRLLSMTMNLSSSSRVRPQRREYNFFEQETHLHDADQRLTFPLSPLRRTDSLRICPSPQRSPSYRALQKKSNTLCKNPLDYDDDDRTMAETITSNASELSSSPCQTSPTQRFKVYFESSFHSLQILEDITDGSVADDELLSDGDDDDMTIPTSVQAATPSERQVDSRRLLPTVSIQQRSILRRRPANGGIESPKVVSVRERMKTFETR